MRCWCQNTAHIWPLSGLLNTSVLRTSLVSQCSYSLYSSIWNDLFRIVTGCLRPTATDHLPILLGIHPDKLCQLGATLLGLPWISVPDHILYDLLSRFSDACQERIRFIRPFLRTARNLLNNLAGLSNRVSHKQSINGTWCTARIHPGFSFSYPYQYQACLDKFALTACVKLNILQTCVGDFIRPCTNGVSFFYQIRCAAPLSKPQLTL